MLAQHAKPFESMLCNLQQTTSPRSKTWMIEIIENVYKNKKHQIIFVRKRFARVNTQRLTRYSSSLILKITISSAFTNKDQ